MIGVDSGLQPERRAPPPVPARRGARPPARPSAERRPEDQARALLHAGYTVAPLAAGFDKFADRLVDWERYLAPGVARSFPGGAPAFMRIVGVVEIAAGLLVAARPRIGGYVVAAWLCGIVGNLVVQRRYLDIALRDVGLAIGALALARLAEARS